MSIYSRKHYLRSLPDCTTWVRRDSLRTISAAAIPSKIGAWRDRNRNGRDALFAYRVPAGR
jgi:hypothetical protein